MSGTRLSDVPPRKPIERLLLRRVAILGNIDVIDASYTSHRFPPHAHADFVFAVVEGGVCQVWREGRTYTATEGDVVVLQPGDVHSVTPGTSAGWQSRAVVVPEAAMQSLERHVSRSASAAVRFDRPVIRDQRVASALSSINESLQSPSVGDHVATALRLLLEEVVDRYASMAPPHSAMHPTIAAVVRHIDVHLASPLSLESLGSVANMSAFHFARLFRAQVGVPPHAYQTIRRIAAARRLLQRGATASRVAAATGFGDQSHLHRHFLRIMGMTPGQYREACRAVLPPDAPRVAP